MQLIGVDVPQDQKGRAGWPSLFVFCAAVFSLAASFLPGQAYRWCTIALLLAASAPWRMLPVNSLGAAIGLFCAWLLANALFITPIYQAESIYLPLMFLAAFACGAALNRDTATQLFRAGVALLAALVLLGLLQYFFDFWQPNPIPRRATATFVTPNTFATAINLFLLPLAALYIAGRGSRNVYFLSLWLFAGLVASESRGGMVAFFSALGFVIACMGTARIWRQRSQLLRLLGGWLAAWIVIVAAASALTPLVRGLDSVAPSADAWIARPIADRVELYATAVQLALERPFAGAGANMFPPLFEAAKSSAAAGYTYEYVHNDYLQTWLEYGAIGLVLLLVLVLLTLAYAWRAGRREPGNPLPLACGAASASCFVHAMVDFPLAIPFILVVLGGFIGALAAYPLRNSGERESANVSAPVGEVFTPVIRYAFAAAVLAWLAQPVIAEFAGNRALHFLFSGSVDRALYWQSVARRFEPRNAARYWAEAVIWRDQAVASGNRNFAERADALFAEALRVNPYEITVLIDRTGLHRRNRDLLEHAAPPAEVVAWAERGVMLRPQSIPAQVELARTLAFAGERERARAVAKALLDRHPDLAAARRLAAEL